MMHFKNNHQLITEILLTLMFADWVIAEVIPPTNCSTFSNKSRFERIYSRKKRYVVFSPGSAVVSAVTLLKSLNTKPTGINLLNEFEFYYPLQTTIEEWYPKEPVEPINREGEESLDYDNNSIEESDQRSKPQKKWKNYDSEENLYWERYAVHRDRRDILGHIERVATENGFEIKSCLLRVICEANHYLLPPGKSFLQDVLRILLTTTHLDNVPDEYSQAMKASEDDCINEFGSKCRYSILDFLFQ